jgi:hypothetical protein
MSALLALGLAGLAVSSSLRAADKDSDKKEKEKLIAAAREIITQTYGKSPDDQKKEAPELAKKYDIGHVMHAAFKPRDKGGLGIGAKPDAILPDSIELKIMALAKKAPTKAALTKEADDLVKAIEITRTIAEINTYWVPKKKEPGKDPKDWTKFNEDMKKGSEELIKALKSGDPAAVNKAATNLNSSCVNCHGVFRDS